MPKIGDETVEIEGRVEARTAKAVLIEMTNNGEQVWLPKSQIHEEFDNGDGLFTFHISEWIAKKNGII